METDTQANIKMISTKAEAPRPQSTERTMMVTGKKASKAASVSSKTELATLSLQETGRTISHLFKKLKMRNGSQRKRNRLKSQ